jgi:Ca2+-transporting ATPase
MEFDTKCKSTIVKIATLDFTSERKSMSTVVSGYKNEKDLLLKGAPDRVIEKCVTFMTADNQQATMTNDIKQRIIKEVAELSGQGLRCLAIAEVPNAGKLTRVTNENKSIVLSDISKYSEQE